MIIRMVKVYHTQQNFSSREQISEVADWPKIQLQENYSQADTLIQLKAGGKPSTWLPPERLRKQDLSLYYFSSLTITAHQKSPGEEL